MTVRPAWSVRGQGHTASWFEVRLAFPDGARVEALAVLSGGGLWLEDVRAEPPLSLDDLGQLPDWLEDPLLEACVPEARRGGAHGHRARPPWPCGTEGRRLVARTYLEARDRGADPVLAVMDATGHSRRRSLRMIAGAREEGFLASRHLRGGAANQGVTASPACGGSRRTAER